MIIDNDISSRAERGVTFSPALQNREAGCACLGKSLPVVQSGVKGAICQDILRLLAHIWKILSQAILKL